MLWHMVGPIAWLNIPTAHTAQRWPKKSCWFRHILLSSKHLEQFIFPLKESSSHTLKSHSEPWWDTWGWSRGELGSSVHTKTALLLHPQRQACLTPCVPPAVSLAHWGASRKMLVLSSVTRNVIKGCSVFCDRLRNYLLGKLSTYK